ncbi:hypothetical protein, partial [Roseovarius sp.]|uniref:hypothetical protein n=1 Tax=Roseovarius sp. TaxID=1486281 RepID=UPI003569DC24
PVDTLPTCQGQRHLNKSPMAIHNSDVERQAPLDNGHLDQAVFGSPMMPQADSLPEDPKLPP